MLDFVCPASSSGLVVILGTNLYNFIKKILTQVALEVTVLAFIQIFRHVKVQILIDRCWIKLPRSFNVSEEE